MDLYEYVVRLDQTTDGDRTYVAEAPGLPGCMAHGASVTEAKRNLDEARALYLDDLHARELSFAQEPLPSRMTVVTRTVTLESRVEEKAPLAAASLQAVG